MTTINRDGTSLEVVTNFCGCEAEAGASDVVPSPDGSRFALIETAPNDGQNESFLMTLDPSGNGNVAWTGPVSQSARAPDWQRLPG